MNFLCSISKSGAACVTCTILISLCCRMDKHMKGWFTEMNDMWPGQAMAMQVDEILHHEKSQYQDILVFKRCVCVCVHVCVCVAGSPK